MFCRACSAHFCAAFQIKKRGAPPEGGGEVYLRVPVVKSLSPINLLDEGMIKRVRGIAYTTKISPQMANRLVDGARGILNNLLPDVYIYTDHFKGKDSGLSVTHWRTISALQIGLLDVAAICARGDWFMCLCAWC